MHTQILECIMTHLPNFFHSVVWCMYTSKADSSLQCQHKSLYFFSFSHTPAGLYQMMWIFIHTFTLILNNSLKIDAKLNTVVYLLIFYHPFELYVQNVTISSTIHLLLYVHKLSYFGQVTTNQLQQKYWEEKTYRYCI